MNLEPVEEDSPPPPPPPPPDEEERGSFVAGFVGRLVSVVSVGMARAAGVEDPTRYAVREWEQDLLNSCGVGLARMGEWLDPRDPRVAGGLVVLMVAGRVMMIRVERRKRPGREPAGPAEAPDVDSAGFVRDP